MSHDVARVRRITFILVASLALTLSMASATLGSAKIQHLISPGGIEAWFVQEPTAPLISIEFAFAGGAAQDPAAKAGVANLVANLLGEGSGDLDFQGLPQAAGSPRHRAFFQSDPRYHPRQFADSW